MISSLGRPLRRGFLYVTRKTKLVLFPPPAKDGRRRLQAIFAFFFFSQAPEGETPPPPFPPLLRTEPPSADSLWRAGDEGSFSFQKIENLPLPVPPDGRPPFFPLKEKAPFSACPSKGSPSFRRSKGPFSATILSFFPFFPY